MVRLFVGSFLKEDEAARIDQFGRSNHERLGALTKSSVRTVDGTNLHVTWVFIGEVAQEKVPAVQDLLRREVEFLKTGTGVAESFVHYGEKHPPARPGLGRKISIDVEYDFIEAWPSVEAGRVLVATPTVVPEAVLRIGLALRMAMSKLGTGGQGDQRDLLFRPHITIMRLNPPDNLGDGKLIAALRELLPIRQRIDSVHLIQSHLGRGSGEYEIISSQK